jgi:UDP-GlcNAc:undecaprenyl-phosphate GlcNAc-1-phosphate transferase
MISASMILRQLLLFLPINLPDIASIIIGGGCAFVLAYLLTFAVGAFCRKVGWLDRPAARRVHTKAVPRLGGVAMFLAFLIASLLFYNPGPSLNAHAHEITIYWLLISAGALMVIVHTYDDVIGLKPWPKLLAQTIAVIIILGPWGNMFNGILLFTFNNPFGRDIAQHGAPWYLQPTLFLIVHDATIRLAAIPAVLFTWFWIAGMMNTVNLIDGLDGLATGVVAIAALFITIISFILQQYSIAILSAIFTGAVLGFLPHNWSPAKIFMGDSGSMFLGLGLAVLSIMGGAKLALAFTVLGVPILDVAVVMINRIRRGQSPLHYDKTHLHYRLMATGLSTKQICYVFYGLTFIFGLLALGLPRIYKFVGIALLVVTMAGLIYWIDYRQRQQGTPIKLGGPDPEPKGGNEEPQEEVSDGRWNATPEYEASRVGVPERSQAPPH